MHCLKLLHIIRCIIDVLQNEVNTISLCTWIRWWHFIACLHMNHLVTLYWILLTNSIVCTLFHIIIGRWTILCWRVLSSIEHVSLHLLPISGDPQTKKSFGTSIANVMTNHFEFQNGLSLAFYNTTLDAMQKDKCSDLIKSDLIKNISPNILRLQMFLDFLCYTLKKTGHHIGVWLESCHRGNWLQAWLYRFPYSRWGR